MVLSLCFWKEKFCSYHRIDVTGISLKRLPLPIRKISQAQSKFV